VGPRAASTATGGAFGRRHDDLVVLNRARVGVFCGASFADNAEQFSARRRARAARRACPAREQRAIASDDCRAAMRRSAARVRSLAVKSRRRKKRATNFPDLSENVLHIFCECVQLSIKELRFRLAYDARLLELGGFGRAKTPLPFLYGGRTVAKKKTAKKKTAKKAAKKKGAKKATKKKGAKKATKKKGAKKKSAKKKTSTKSSGM
jgi:hypothetical protein